MARDMAEHMTLEESKRMAEHAGKQAREATLLRMKEEAERRALEEIKQQMEEEAAK